MNTESLRNASRAAALALGLAASAGALAQSSNSGLSGRGANGDVAHVRNVDTGFEREAKVRDGMFRLRNLPVGTYEVTLRHADGSTEGPVLAAAKVGVTQRVTF
jgi:hypothetical protein